MPIPSSTCLLANIAGPAPPHSLIAPVQFNLDRASHLERTDGWPHPSLPAENPVVQPGLGWALEVLEKIARIEIWDQNQTRAGDVLFDKELL